LRSRWERRTDGSGNGLQAMSLPGSGRRIQGGEPVAERARGRYGAVLKRQARNDEPGEGVPQRNHRCGGGKGRFEAPTSPETASDEVRSVDPQWLRAVAGSEGQNAVRLWMPGSGRACRLADELRRRVRHPDLPFGRKPDAGTPGRGQEAQEGRRSRERRANLPVDRHPGAPEPGLFRHVGSKRRRGDAASVASRRGGGIPWRA
jgi:hypothetical protein